MKKRVALLISLFLLVASVSAGFSVFAQDPIQLGSSSTYYTYDGITKTLTISGSGATPTYSNQNGTPWSEYRADIKHIVVKEGITTLGNYAFYAFVNCIDVSLPSTLTRINKNVFSYGGFSYIDLPESLTYIDNYAFYGSSLKKITIPSEVTNIGKYAFEINTCLSEVEFSVDAVCAVRECAFCGCTSLINLVVPSGVSLEGYSFGFIQSHAELISENITIYAYKNTSAHTYAISYKINFVDMATMIIPLTQGATIKAEIVKSSGSEDQNEDLFESSYRSIYFSFTPEYNTEYKVFSSGNTDVKVFLYDENKKLLEKADDISDYDLNFSLTYSYQKDKTYYLKIMGVGVEGFFSITAMPVNVASISANFEPALSFTEYVDLSTVGGIKKYDYSTYLSMLDVTFIYDTGYSITIPASDSKYDGTDLIVFDNQNTNPWTIGENYVTVRYGDLECFANVTLVEHTHSYTSEIVPPTFYDKGYTIYTCIYCGSSYNADFVEKLGKEISGYVFLMENPQGTYDNNIGVTDAEIYLDGVYVGKTDAEGRYSFLSETGSHTLTVMPLYGPDKEVLLNISSDMFLDNIAVIGFDFNNDSVINARDYAELFKLAKGDKAYTADYNKDGIINALDFEFAKNFFTVKNVSD